MEISITQLIYWGLSIAAPLSGLIGLALWLFKRWAEKWMQSRFDLEIEDVRRRHSAEIEHLRYETSRNLDRARKLSETEFEALPKAWMLMEDARGILTWRVSGFGYIYGLDGKSEKELDEFLNGQGLALSQIDKVKAASDKEATYRDEKYWVDKFEVDQAYRKFKDHLSKYRIFISEPIVDRMEEMATLMNEAAVEYQLDFEHKEMKRTRDAANKFRGRGNELRDEIEQMIRYRLAPADLPPLDPDQKYGESK